MRIGAVSNTFFSTTRYMGLKGNNLSNNAMSPLEKQKLQLQEEMKKIEEGKNSKENKDKAIKELQEKLKEIEKQLIEEKNMKLNEKLEGKKDKDKDTNQEKIEEESCENLQVINKEIIIGITSASFHGKNGKVAYSVYRVAEAKGDMTTAKRALSYTMSEIKKSSQSKKLIERGMKEYKKQMDNLKKADILEDREDNNIIQNSVGDEGDSTTNNVEVHSENALKDVTNRESKAKISIKQTLK
ncbi:hypothetical protein [Clostridium botulinum]|uniref:hypothetical protein n=1 Tax=Clostridium botulinum TaxID=1491 RepID=UPI003DA50331